MVGNLPIASVSFEHLGSLVAASDGFRVRQQIVEGKQRKT
jgi:hypothetical protein